MIKNIIKAAFAVFLILSLIGCEAIIGAITGGLVIQEPDDNDLITSGSVRVDVKCYEGEITSVECRRGGVSEYDLDIDCSEGSDYAYLNITLTEGSNTIDVYGYDIDGYEVDSDSVVVRSDTLDPEIHFDDSDFENNIVKTFTSLPIPAISGTVSDANGVRSLTYQGDYGLFGNIDLSGGNPWSLSLSNLNDLPDLTEIEIEFVAEDAAGRTSTFMLNFTYDNPAVP